MTHCSISYPLYPRQSLLSACAKSTLIYHESSLISNVSVFQSSTHSFVYKYNSPWNCKPTRELTFLIMMMSAFSFFFLYSIIFLPIGLPIGSGIILKGNETDRLALIAFKALISDDPQGVMTSWNYSLHFCEWQGITCSRRHQRVLILKLDSQRLVGSLTPYIGNLSFLRSINLQNNSFQGEIPQEVGHLFRLQEFNMSNNSFVGKISINVSHCSDLRILRLGGNKFVGNIPIEFGSLSKLIRLSLTENNLTGWIPASFGNLSSIKILSLSFNSIEGGIPISLCQLKNLEFLSLGPNILSGVFPPCLYNISSLEILSIPDSQQIGSLPLEIGLNLPNIRNFLIGGNLFFGSIPISLFNASRLEILEIGNNNFVGNVPLEIGNLKVVRHLLLGFNHLGSGKVDDLKFLNSLTNCSNLEVLEFSLNNFGGKLPNSIANLSTRLTILYLSTNQIFGTIPSEIGNLINLIGLDMSANFLDGSIPKEIGKLQKLQGLNLSANRFSGYIPNSLGNITQISSLYLSHNSLVGNIISNFENSKFLKILDLSKNNLNGTIPKWVIGSSSQLVNLNLAYNSFSGSIPLEVGNMKNLAELNLSENNMSGEIPSTLGSCLSLEHLYLQGNFFQGPIPSSFSALKVIQDVDLSRNNLSGKIPKDLDNLPFLKKLNLSINDLEGEVPIKGVFQNTSAFTLFGNSKLCGGVPKLQLPPCLIQKSKQRRISLAFKVTIGAILFTIVGASILVLYWRRKLRMKPSSNNFLGDWYERVSYNELHKATEGFSSANLIGIGNFGSVYKGVLHPDEKLIAVKVFNLNVRGGSRSFMNECKALRNVRHRNLLKIITACSSVDIRGNDFKALVFEFMSNGSLEDLLHPSENRRHLNFHQRLSITIDIACALDYLHNHGQTPIIHCDLKPSNILLDDDMTAHVGDFGLVKILSQSNEIETNPVLIQGSVGYIPPEYSMGAEISKQGDVYSYGILVLEMFTGKKPTDEIFRDGLSLHEFSKMALTGRVMEVVDPRLLSEDHYQVTNDFESHQRYNATYKMQKCLISIFKIGVLCSTESLGDRMEIKDVLTELHMIKKMFHEGIIHS